MSSWQQSVTGRVRAS